MSKIHHTHTHGQAFTCGAACASINGYGRTETSVDKLIAAVKSVFTKHSL